jgi:hypothetical protein
MEKLGKKMVYGGYLFLAMAILLLLVLWVRSKQRSREIEERLRDLPVSSNIKQTV